MIGARPPVDQPAFSLSVQASDNRERRDAGREEETEMPTIFVAKSESLQNWASDVGLTSTSTSWG